ncbi:MAG: aminotransferase class I/II-fold pyridoxal phosphate-dependent enzyme [Saprospiraceae bacterium]|nr:aminotransferase class I/II-fold pyridoxal phosphate-dependent enzyme [Saprospiraceae bacterium]
MAKDLEFSTKCLQDPNTSDVTPHVLPIYASSSFDFRQVDDAVKIFQGKKDGFVYSRYSNPTVNAVEEKIARLETHNTGMEGRALMTSSGMSAIHTLLLALLKPGQCVLTQGNLYGGTTELFNTVYQPLQVEVSFINFKDLKSVEAALKKNDQIRLIYLETPANPTLDCVDIEVITGLAKTYNCYTVIDNTFATPYLQRPLAMNCDFVIHSTTKYLNGHGSGMAGVIVGKKDDNLWPEIWKTMKLTGTNTNAFDAWLVNNGIKTLPLRMDRQCENALAVAQHLDQHSDVIRVNYPGLTSFVGHDIAKKQMSDFGAMLSFSVRGGQRRALKLIDSLEICKMAPTLGDVDSLVLHPATSSHINVSEELRKEYSIDDGLIRLSVGIENKNDLIADLEKALKISEK